MLTGVTLRAVPVAQEFQKRHSVHGGLGPGLHCAHPVPWFPLVVRPQFQLQIVNIVSDQISDG